jgi:alpha-ribazole phosphatase
MKLIWVRHGITAINKERRYLGHYDCMLDDEGIRQVEQTAAAMKSLKVDMIYTSDLQRSVQTAEIIAEALSVPHVIQSHLLRELDFGKWDQHTYDEVYEMNQGLLRSWYDDPMNIAPPNGETLKTLGGRIDQLLSQIIQKHKSETVIIVSHGGPIRWFQAKWIKCEPSQFWYVQGLRHGMAAAYEKIEDQLFKQTDIFKGE